MPAISEANPDGGDMDRRALRACPRCGVVHRVPGLRRGETARCVRCGSGVFRPAVLARHRTRAGAVALSALILYPFAISLPMIEAERFGHRSSASIVEGITSLLSAGEWFVGIVVLLCSIVFPVGKLLAILLLSLESAQLHARHRAWTYRIVEWTGRWGMLDVLLVAVLVAIVKLGDAVEVHPGPAVLAFTLCVVLSLLAAALFDPHALWEAEP